MYQGNPRLRKSGEEVEYTQETISEFAKCKEDIIYFAEHYFWITSIAKGRHLIPLWDFQKKMLKAIAHPPNDKRHVIVLSSRQIGKALDLETDIITPVGWRKMRDIEVGDSVYDDNGNEVQVNYVSPVMYDRNVYEITFSNGEKIKADENHLWEVMSGDEKKVLSTKEMIELNEKFKQYSKRIHIEYLKEPVKFADKDIPLHPYILGLYLGDGSKSDGRITCSIEDYDEYKEKIESLGWEISKWSMDKRRENTGYFFIRGLAKRLKEMNQLGNKYIPDDYVFNSLENRVELMRGLMDTDGYCNKAGSCFFYNTNLQIIEKVKWILSSLGIKFTKRIKETGFLDCYTLTFCNSDVDLFSLQRKKCRLLESQNHLKSKRIYIDSIEKVDSVAVKCIQVNNDSHLFLCGKTMIPTHNTTVNTIYLLWYALFHRDQQIGILANKEKTAISIMKRIKFAFENLPLWLQQGIQEGGWSKKEISLENGMVLMASSTASSAFRMETMSMLYLDEFAFVPNHIADDFMASVYPTIISDESQRSKMIIVSCVSKDSYVFTNDGIKQVLDFVDENKYGAYQVQNYSVLGKDKFNEGNILVNSGNTKTKIIKTTSSELECSYEHKFWACKNGKYDWYKSSELTTDDYIAIRYGMDIWGNYDEIDWQPEISNHHKNIFECKKITPDIAYFLGLFIAEGYVRKIENRSGQIVITCGDNVKDSIENIGMNCTCNDGIHYVFSSKTFVDFIEFLGFDINKKAKEKIIPKRLMQMSKENMKALIQGLFDGDGYSRKDKGYVGVGLSSKELIKQIRMILLNFGILTDYQEVLTKPTKKVKVESMQYRISCNGYFSKKFYKEIGFRFERKQLKEQFIREGKRSGGCDIIPYAVDFLRKKIKHDKNVKLFNGCHKNNIHFSRKFVLENKNDLLKYGDEECINWFNDNVNENIKWEKISEIKDAENEVFDFSLKEIENDKWCHSVIYNGILAHQTPNGMNHFYHIWQKAIRGMHDSKKGNNFYPIKVKWDEVPGRGKKFRENTIKDIGIVRWNQEFAGKFLGSSNTLIDSDLLERVETEDPIAVKWEGLLQIYEMPQDGAFYIIGADSSKGTGLDSSVIQVLRVESEHDVRQVAIYRYDQINPHTFAQIVMAVSDFYNKAYVMVENNDVGQTVADTMWFEYEFDRIVNCDKKGLGIRATKKTKLAANMLLKRYMENGWLELIDKRTLFELSKYAEVRPNVFKAGREDHDDCVTALLWALYFLTTTYFDGKNINVKEIDDKFKINEEDFEEPVFILD